jgi:hypothetical protein
MSEDDICEIADRQLTTNLALVSQETRAILAGAKEQAHPPYAA